MANNEVVKYHNELNTVVMNRWTAEEFNIFFTILAKAKEKGVQELNIELEEIKSLIGHNQSWKKLIDIVDKATDKMFMIFYKEGRGAGSKKFTLFSKSAISKDGTQLIIKLNEEYEYIINKLTKNFTIFELSEYVSLKSTYSKTMYRLLKQWRTIGKKKFKKEDLFDLLDVPESTQAPSNFNKRVIKPITDELTPIFLGLNISTVRAKTQGRPITHYEFTWQAETPGTWIEGKYDKPKYTPKTKQKIIKEVPDWLDNTSALQQPADPEKTKQIQEKLTLLFGNSD